MAINLPIISEWNPAGVNKAIADFKKLETNGQKASFAIKKAAVPAGLAIAALGAVAFDAVKAFAEDEAAAEKLGLTLQNVTYATDAQIASVEQFITKTSMAAAVADDELRPALDKLVRGTGDVAQAQDLLTLALDVSAGTGKDLGAVADALSKAYNGNFTALKKLDPALAALIEEGADADDVFGRLGATFKNQASTAANTTSGKMKNLSIQMGEFKESIGAAVAPLIQKMLPALLKFSTFAQQNTKLIVTLGAVIGTFALAIIGVNAGLAIYNTIQALTLALNTALTASFSALWVATGAVVIIAIIAALVALQVKFDIFGKAIDGIKIGFDAVWGAIKFVFDWAKNNWPLLLAIITGPFGLAILAIVKFKDSIVGVLQGIKDFAVTIFDGIIGAYRSVMNGILSLMESGINKAIKGLNAALDAVDKGAGPLVNFGKIPNVSIPRLAEGGIVTGPTLAMIGEGREPEAVIPLSKLASMGFGGGGANITVNVSSADPNSVVAALQQYIRDRGALPITVNPTAFRG